MVLAFMVWGRIRDGAQVRYRFGTVAVDRGNVTAFVTATGSVNPTVTYKILSRIEGTVTEVLVDFNSPVEKGQPLARIDDEPLARKVEMARADLKRARAEAELLGKTYATNKELHAEGFISREELQNSRARHLAALAEVERAETALRMAEDDLEAATLRSPIDGTVISMNVKPGQSVSPAQTEPLFVVAANTSRMEVKVNVSEADIGLVEPGQRAYFTVDAYPGTEFTGTVSTIINDPIVRDNVVTYDVIVEVENPDGKLRPGMTAAVRLLVAERRDVLRVPNAALRFIPPPTAKVGGDVDGLDTGAHVVWTVRGRDVLVPVRVKSGISDDRYTELVEADGLGEGDHVVVEAVREGPAGPADPLGPIRLPQPKRF